MDPESCCRTSNTSPHVAQLAQNKQSQQGPSGDTFSVDVRDCGWRDLHCTHRCGEGRVVGVTVLSASVPVCGRSEREEEGVWIWSLRVVFTAEFVGRQ